MHDEDSGLTDPPRIKAQDTPIDVTTIIAECLARNRGPNPDNPERRQTPDYGIVATLHDAVLDIRLVLHRGKTYCCEEWECHVGLSSGERWINLRQQLDSAGIAVAPRLELRGSCMIEKGAIFFDFSKPDPDRRGWYGFAPANAHSYEVVYLEGVE